MLIGTQAAFAPADSAALKAAVGTCTRAWNNNIGGYDYPCSGGCLGETADGSCPTFAASNDATGNPYGVIGDWDVSAVTTMEKSKCTLSPSLWPPSVVVVLNTTTRVSSDYTSHTFCYLVFVCVETVSFVVCGGLVTSFLCCTLSCSVL